MIAVDTHVIVWDALRSRRISRKAREAMDKANAGDGIILCDISLWEIAMLMASKRLKIDAPCSEFMSYVRKSNVYHMQPITPAIAELSARLFGEAHKDPADRIIAATAIVSRVPLVTADEFLRSSQEVETIW
jgi:PIN domain nuclease of toxin-antitoxin system